MKYLFNALVAAILLFSCDRPEIINRPSYEEFVTHVIPGSISYNSCVFDHFPPDKLTNNNSLYFCRDGVGPVMYSLMIKRSEHYITAIYHWNNTELLSDAIYFQGFSFQIDSATWHDLTKRSSELLEKATGDSYSDGVMDGASYILCYNGKSVIVNKGPLRKEFLEFSEFIINTIIQPIEKLRTKTSFEVPNPNL